MNGCTINSKDRCRESGAHGVAKTYYLHNLLYQNIRSFLLNDILVMMKSILVRNTTSRRRLCHRGQNPEFLHLVGSERFLAIRRSRLLFLLFSLFLLHLKSDRRLQHSYPSFMLHEHCL